MGQLSLYLVDVGEALCEQLGEEAGGFFEAHAAAGASKGTLVRNRLEVSLEVVLWKGSRPCDPERSRMRP